MNKTITIKGAHYSTNKCEREIKENNNNNSIENNLAKVFQYQFLVLRSIVVEEKEFHD